MDPFPLFVLKDPRFCLLLPFYQQALGPMSYVVTMRNREDITRSIVRRNEEWRRPSRLPWRLARACLHTALGGYEPIRPISTEAALALWDHYYARLEATLQAQSVMCIHYEKLMADPQEECARLMNSLGRRGQTPDVSVISPSFNNGRNRDPDTSSLKVADRIRRKNTVSP